jgi:hypothetical protein
MKRLLVQPLGLRVSEGFVIKSVFPEIVFPLHEFVLQLLGFH